MLQGHLCAATIIFRDLSFLNDQGGIGITSGRRSTTVRQATRMFTLTRSAHQASRSARIKASRPVGEMTTSLVSIVRLGHHSFVSRDSSELFALKQWVDITGAAPGMFNLSEQFNHDGILCEGDAQFYPNGSRILVDSGYVRCFV